MTFNLMGKAVKILKLPTVNYENTPVTIIPAQQGDANSRFVNISLYDDRGDISLGAYTKVVLNATLPDGSRNSIWRENSRLCKSMDHQIVGR